MFAELTRRVTQAAPKSELIICGLGARFEHYQQLADGEVDLLITLWPESLKLKAYSRASHLSSLEHIPGQGAILDAQLADLGLTVHTPLRTQFLGMAPSILAATDLIFTTGRQLADDMAAQAPLSIAAFPGSVKPFRYN